jgi:hypothetical protein
VLAAVGVVVLLVSLLRLRDFAVRENETDARSLVERLGRLAERHTDASGATSIAALIASDASMSRQLDDAEFLSDGALLRRHGYLFECGARDGRTLVRAWPWRYSETGLGVFAWSREHHLVGHRNDAGQWDGPDDPPAMEALDEWRDLEEGR